MVQVTELSYMGIGVKNPDEWKNFAARIIGMELVEDEGRDRCYLRMDYWHHRIVLHADDSDDLMYLGFRVAGPRSSVRCSSNSRRRALNSASARTKKPPSVTYSKY